MDTPKQLVRLIGRLGKGGRIVYARFVKRSTGEERRMIFRLGVTLGRYFGSPERLREDARNRCMTVYDMASGGFRRLPLDGILELRGTP